MAAAEEVLRKALEIDPELAKTHFFLATAIKTMGRYDEALEHLRHRRRAVPARPRGAQPDRPRALPEAAVPGSDRRAPEGARHRPRGPAGALQPHALGPGAGRQGERRARAEALRALQGGRGGAGHHRARTASSTPTTTTSASRSTSTASVPLSAAKAPPPYRRVANAGGAPHRPDGAGQSSPPRGEPIEDPSSWSLAGAAVFTLCALPLAAADLSSRTRPLWPGSASSTRAAPRARNTCPRRWARACAFLDFDNDGGQDVLLVNSMEWPAGGKKALPALYRNNGKGSLHRRHARVRARRRGCTAWGSRPPTTTTTAGPTSSSPPSAGTASSATRAAASSRTSRTRRASAAAGFSTSAALLRLRQGRPARPLRGQLRGVDEGEGPLLHARRQAQVLLHARVVQGPERPPLPQQGRRHVRGRDGQGGPREPDGQGPGRGHARLRLRRLAGPGRRQRHAAQQALPQQQERHLHRRGHARGRGVQRGGGGPGGHGRRCRRLRRLRPARAS